MMGASALEGALIANADRDDPRISGPDASGSDEMQVMSRTPMQVLRRSMWSWCHMLILLLACVDAAATEEPEVPRSFLEGKTGEVEKQIATAARQVRAASGYAAVQGIGQGFRKGATHAGFSLGGGIGVPGLGSREEHDFLLVTAHVSRVVSGRLAKDHWFRGNCELIGEFFSGWQLSPKTAYAVGFTPVFRYDFATSARWVPFLEGGAGVSATDVGRPDLATWFEFHLVAGGGVHRVYSPRLARTFQYRFVHLSNASIRQPNRGVNTIVFLVGLTWLS